MNIRSALCSLAVLCLAAGSVQAQPSDAEINAAIDRGVAYLQTRRDPGEGHFRGHWHGEGYTWGETALTLLALLEGGVQPDAPEIEQGFQWMFAQPLQRVYEVSVAILALEARYMPEEKASIADDQPLATQVRKRFQKIAPARDRKWLAQAVQFLSKHQHASGMWRYPFYGDADLSNAQFAILALKAAQRLGAKVDPAIYLNTATYLVQQQEPAGPPMPSFAVPAADRPIAGLLDKREKRKRRQKKARRSKQDSGGTRTREQQPTGSEFTSRPRTEMQARGWGYKPGDGTRGSMTAAGLAVLVVCKSELEGLRAYKELSPQVDQALRDGAAWIATRFAVDRNPGADQDWLFYYLYTLERAGTLLALDRFGTREWYEEGAAAILARQEAGGRFAAGTSGQQDGDIAGTCFAILFLERSTVPVIKRVKTGGGKVYGGAAQSGTGGPSVVQRPDGRRDVTFRFRGSPGRRVTVAGSFNGWSSDATVLRETAQGVFEGTVVLPPGRHQYKFVVDGQHWQPDPTNPLSEPDGHGGQNSVIEA